MSNLNSKTIMEQELTDLLINAIVAVVSFLVGFLNRKKNK